jgi:hypothetical protein
MLFLAGGPFETPDQFQVVVATIALESPQGPQDGFPARFSWQPLEGAVLYVAGAARETPSGYLTVFRQETAQPFVELDPAGMDPRPGAYAWEVFALGDQGIPIGRGEGAFQVVAP